MRMLCFGDSNTYGYDPRGFFGDRYGAEDRWVDLLAKNTNHEILNGGLNGRTIPSDCSGINHDSVDIIFLMLGTNDLLQGATAQEVSEKMEDFLRLLLPVCKQVVLIVPPPMKRGAWVSSDNLVTESIRLGDFYQSLAQKMDIPFVDTRNWGIELCFDGVHFTEAGHRTFANRMAEMI